MSPTKEEIEYYDKLYRITPYNRREDVWYRAYLEAVEALRMVHDSVGSAYYPSEDEIIKIEAILEKAPEEKEL
jgi:hypothetical protein